MSQPSPTAPVTPAREFKPFVAPETTMAELTPKAIIAGALFGILFGASTVYLALKAGLTVSASIPIAVIAISLGRKLLKTTILENNIIQTAGSAGESIAAGVVFTLPGFLFLSAGADGQSVGAGYFNYCTLFILALVGGILGVLMMVPLRRALIVKEHGELQYPEGAACASVLIAGEKGGDFAKTAFQGVGISMVYALLQKVFHVIAETPAWVSARTNKWLPNATVNGEITPEYMGVGYIIGPKIAGVLVAGGVLAWLGLIPLLGFLVPGDAGRRRSSSRWATPRRSSAGTRPPTPSPTPPTPSTGPTSARSAPARWRPAASSPCIKTLPTIYSSLRDSIRSLSDKAAAAGVKRTERDLSFVTVIAGSLALVVVLAAPPHHAGQQLRHPPHGGGAGHRLRLHLRHRLLAHRRAHRLLVQPHLRHDHRHAHGHRHDLRGARLDRLGLRAHGAGGGRHGLHRRRQRRRHLAGPQDRLPGRRHAAGPADLALRRRHRLGGGHRLDGEHPRHARPPSSSPRGSTHAIGTEKFPAPQGTLMATLIKGLLSLNLDWVYVLVGVFFSITMELCGVKALSFAVGLYLPLSTTLPIWVGGVVKGLVDWVAQRKGGPAEDAELGGGSLMATGLVAGGALTGVVVAILNVFAGDTMAKASIEEPLTAAIGHGGYQLLGRGGLPRARRPPLPRLAEEAAGPVMRPAPLALAGLALFLALPGCTRGADAEARARLTGRAPAAGQAAAAPDLSAPGALLLLDAGEAARRLGSLDWRGAVHFTAGRAGPGGRAGRGDRAPRRPPARHRGVRPPTQRDRRPAPGRAA